MAKKVKEPLRSGIANTPVVIQLEALECGAACLAMILAYYEKWIPLEKVRVDCGVSRDGSNAKNIVQAARNYGLKATGYKYEIDTLKKEGKFPCIIHWNFNHFVVLNGFTGNKAYINDPAKGFYTVPMKDFDNAFTGVVLMFEPDVDFIPSGKQKSVFSFARKMLRGAGFAIIFTIFSSVISALLGLITPAFSRIYLDRLLTQQNPTWTGPFFIALILIDLLALTIDAISCSYRLKISGKMAVYGHTQYMWKVLNLPIEFFSQRMAGDIQGRKGKTGSIANSLITTFAPLLLNAAMSVFYLFVMIRYSWILTAVGIGTVIINSAISTAITKKRVNIAKVSARDQAKLSSASVAGIEMIETIKSSGAEEGFFSKWAGYQANVNSQKVKVTKINTYLGMIPTFISGLSNTVVLILGVLFCFRGDFTVGMIMQFQGFLGLFFTPTMTLVDAGQRLQEMRTDMERIDDVLEYPSDDAFKDEELSEDKTYSKLSGAIEMKNVTFGYSRLAEPLIKNFNLSLKRGGSIAIVGQTGCGKSTISKLISGLYQPWDGEILFDGKITKEIDKSIFKSSLAVVDQEITMFEGTIMDNIKMWDSSIENFEVILAAKDAQIHDDIIARDGGYYYKINENAKDFSGGQRQRLEIARVLAQDPSIIIMDEATSALDAKTENEVVKAIKRRGITSIIVAHRLSTIRSCDEIIVMDHGNIVDRGTHDELLNKCELYRSLVVNE